MSIRITPAALAASGILFAVGVAVIGDWAKPKAAADESATDDQVTASFERELSREPGPAMRVSRESIDEDVLYRTINSVHWTVDGPSDEDIRQTEKVTPAQ